VRIGEWLECPPRWWRFGRFLAHWLDVVMRNGPENSPLDEPEAQRSLLLMSLLAVATGMIAGTGAWAFRMMIGLVHNVLFLGDPSFHYDANVHTPASPWGWGVTTQKHS